MANWMTKCLVITHGEQYLNELVCHSKEHITQSIGNQEIIKSFTQFSVQKISSRKLLPMQCALPNLHSSQLKYFGVLPP